MATRIFTTMSCVVRFYSAYARPSINIAKPDIIKRTPSNRPIAHAPDIGQSLAMMIPSAIVINPLMSIQPQPFAGFIANDVVIVNIQKIKK